VAHAAAAALQARNLDRSRVLEARLVE
jgi:hypothetical protein